MFGDNDTLSAVVAKLVSADLLIILSDIDGLYDRNPKEDKGGRLISFVDDLNDKVLEYAGGSGTNRGTGGMITKLNAARIATQAGVNLVIANGGDPMVMLDIIKGKDVGTLFTSRNAGRAGEPVK
jgi:glutamate 5-kinase